MIIRPTHPLISCICVTAYRPQFLLKAVINFDNQTYPNKELVISYPNNDFLTRDLVKNIIEISDLNIIIIERKISVSLGQARNEAVLKSNGEYVCTWDDDDWYADRRLSGQHNVLLTLKQKREATILRNVLIYDGLKDNAYLSGDYNWAGTLLCKKEIIVNHPYDDSDSIEDKHLVSYLITSKYLHYIQDRGDLYIFNYHGDNTIHKHYFTFLIKRGQLLTEESKIWIKGMLNKNIDIVLS